MVVLLRLRWRIELLLVGKVFVDERLRDYIGPALLRPAGVLRRLDAAPRLTVRRGLRAIDGAAEDRRGG
ncbi:MAG: hypothetical protein ACUVSY_01065 [Roseiflexus sp.]